MHCLDPEVGDADAELSMHLTYPLVAVECLSMILCKGCSTPYLNIKSKNGCQSTAVFLFGVHISCYKSALPNLKENIKENVKVAFISYFTIYKSRKVW